MKRLAPAQPCPCGGASTSKASKSLSYGQCCGRWLEGDAIHGPFAPDAHHLMRSRYSAFVLERKDYLRATWQAGHRPATIEFDPGVKWLGLEVRDVRSTGADTAEVEFVARQKPPVGPAVRLHERSRFVLEGGRWLYLDGTQF
ncbi:MAG: YchJ family protein [Rhodoferax sp.]